MRAVLILVAALMLGATGGYALTILSSPPAAQPKLPKARMIAMAPSPEELPEEADKQWTAEADDNAAQNAEAASPANAPGAE